MDGNLMIQIVVLLVSMVTGWAYVRFTIAQHTKEIEENKVKSEHSHTEIHKRIDASFKRIDGDSDRLLLLESNQNGLLSMATARSEFVSKLELELQMKLVNQTMSSIQKEVDRDGKKLDKIIDILEKSGTMNETK